MVMNHATSGAFASRCEEELKQALFSAKQRRPSGTPASMPNGDYVSVGHQIAIESAFHLDVAKCRGLLQRFADQAASMNGEQRIKAEERLRQYQSDLITMQSVLARPEQPLLGSTAVPQRSPHTAFLGPSSTQSVQTPLQGTSQAIQETQRMAQESEEISLTILNDLRRQREEIYKAQQTLQVTDTHVGQSNRLMREMFARMNVNRVLSYALIALLAFSIIVVLYYKLTR
jgi:hypothetical protein